MGVNKVILIGNVGKDPETKTLESGVKVAKFPLATSETFTTKDNRKVTNTEWHEIVVWRGLAEVVEKYVKKGNPLYIEGKIRTRSWEDKNGNKRYTTEIVANELQMLGTKQEAQQASTAPEGKESGGHDIPPEEDDLPF